MPLRFTEASPPPDLSTQLPAGAPPKIVAPAPPAESPSVSKPDRLVDAPLAKPAAALAPLAESGPPPAEKEKPEAKIPLQIIPDETRPKVKAEDFLPFFQFPGSSTNDTPAPLPPGRQPPSTATYRLQ